MTLTAEDIARRLGGKFQGGQYMARCPAHQDRTPSLAIREGEDGKVLFHCHAGCSQEAVIDRLCRDGVLPNSGKSLSTINGIVAHHAPKMRSDDDWAPVLPVPEGAPRCDIAALIGAQLTDHWDYLDKDGRLLGYVARVEGPDGKKILPITYCAAPNGARGWRLKGFPAPRPLYGLQSLAQRPDAPVLLVEGEKTACTAAEVFEDHVVATWCGGAKALDKADLSPLKGRAVTLWPDADAEGEAAMAKAGAMLDRIGASSVRIVKLPAGLPKGWDLADDWLTGLDPLALVASAKDRRTEKLSALKIGNAAELVSREFKEPKWAIRDLIAEGLAILAGKPKTGKSWASLDFATAVAGGYSALGNIPCVQGDVLLLALEDNDRRLHQRLRAVLQGQPAPAALHIATEWKRADAGGLDDLDAWLSLHPNARLVVIDTLQMIRGQRSRDAGIYEDDYRAVGGLKALADKHTVPFLVVHHLRKEAAGDPLESVSGTAGITGSADTILVLKREPKDSFGLLYVRGRDVPEAEIAMQFDDQTGKWLRLVGADDFRRSKERNAILRTLQEVDEPMTPVEIASAVGSNRGAVRMRLSRMHKAGEVTKHPNGKYSAAEVL